MSLVYPASSLFSFQGVGTIGNAMFLRNATQKHFSFQFLLHQNRLILRLERQRRKILEEHIMKKIVLLALALVLVFSLAACSGNTGNDNSGGNSTTTPASQGGNETTPEAETRNNDVEHKQNTLKFQKPDLEQAVDGKVAAWVGMNVTDVNIQPDHSYSDVDTYSVAIQNRDNPSEKQKIVTLADAENPEAGNFPTDIVVRGALEFQGCDVAGNYDISVVYSLKTCNTVYPALDSAGNEIKVSCENFELKG